MPATTPEAENPRPSLVERKQRAARGRIVDAADALFAERGFDGVSVADIAERAEVGRTTFFRHFADKSEVVFAKEQAMFDAVADLTAEAWRPTQSVDTLAGAVGALEPLVLRLCEQATADRDAYRRHTALLDAHDELRAREALKHQLVSTRLAEALRRRGASPDVATLAARLVVACYSSGRALAADPGDLVTTTRRAFRSLLALQPGDAG